MQHLRILIMRKSIGLIAVFVCVAIAAGLFYLFASPVVGWPTDTFASDSWAKTVPTERFRMYRDLERKHLIAGATRKEIVALLGKPDYEAPNGTYMTYVLKEAAGEKYSFAFIYILRIRFDKDGKLLSAEVGTD